MGTKWTPWGGRPIGNLREWEWKPAAPGLLTSHFIINVLGTHDIGSEE